MYTQVGNCSVFGNVVGIPKLLYELMTWPHWEILNNHGQPLGSLPRAGRQCRVSALQALYDFPDANPPPTAPQNSSWQLFLLVLVPFTPLSIMCFGNFPKVTQLLSGGSRTHTQICPAPQCLPVTHALSPGPVLTQAPVFLLLFFFFLSCFPGWGGGLGERKSYPITSSFSFLYF